MMDELDKQRLQLIQTEVPVVGILYSAKEYKKVRVPYFTDAEAEWERRYAAVTLPN